MLLRESWHSAKEQQFGGGFWYPQRAARHSRTSREVSPWEPTTLIFSRYNPYDLGVKPCIFPWVLGSKGTWYHQNLKRIDLQCPKPWKYNVLEGNHFLLAAILAYFPRFELLVFRRVNGFRPTGRLMTWGDGVPATDWALAAEKAGAISGWA